MGFNFSFRQVESRRDLDALTGFIAAQDLGYPSYDVWVERARAEVRDGYKTAITAFSDRVIVGDVIYQPDKRIPRIRELKNIRVHQKLRGRYFAEFMLRQMEKDAPESFDAIVCDVREDQPETKRFLASQRYIPAFNLSLYDPNSNDIVMVKLKDQSQKRKIITNLSQIIQAA